MLQFWFHWAVFWDLSSLTSLNLSLVRVVQKRPFLRTFCHGLWWRHQIRLISATSTLFRLDGSKADLKVLKIGFDWPWQKTFSTSFSQKEFLVHFITISSGTSFEKYEIKKRIYVVNQFYQLIVGKSRQKYDHSFCRKMKIFHVKSKFLLFTEVF